MKSLLIFDGTSILAESYYKTLTLEVEQMKSLKESDKSITNEEEDLAFSTLLQSKKGVYINGVQGFFNGLFDAIDKIQPSHVIVTWGCERENNFRRKIFPGYKEDGKVKDKVLIEQEKMVKLMLKNMGIKQVDALEYESLDLAGTIAENFKSSMDIHIYARNVQSLQFTDIATVWFKIPNYRNVIEQYNLNDTLFPRGTVKFDREFLYTYKGLEPYQIPDYRALIGNSFSKVPGIKSVGQVTTSKLLEEYDSIENLYVDIDACKDKLELIEFGKELTSCLMLPINPIEFLAKGREDAFIGKELATYVRDINLDYINELNDDILSVDNIKKDEIIRELKNINLAPIKCKITTKLMALIEELNLTSLIIRYHPFIFSPKSDMYIDGACTLEDDIPVCLKNESGHEKLIIKVEDESICEFEDKLKIDVSNCEYYSQEEVNKRLKVSYEKLLSTFNEITTENMSNAFDLHDGIAEALQATELLTTINSDNHCATHVAEENDIEDMDIEEIEAEEIENESIDIEDIETVETIEAQNNGLSLLNSFTINQYHCNSCNSDFAVIGTAKFCTNCGNGIK